MEQVYVVVNKLMCDLYCLKVTYPPLMELQTTIIELGDTKIISTMAFTTDDHQHLIHFMVVVALDK